ncbi:hypothetical protein CERSUDRAFT_69274 [Gelatoporia subvermispora B]|uniref:Uncharacterized protein n=1 Tax=Ceriporiopsis subvermispora (strain B) TaxID=914234 RepID=M2QZS6_CERS8|nr:hypothetical protein CERSUDRAFT_69274 [Gelatoporia subvermispora B]
MCVGENNAPQAVHYINAQLSALYDNALSCIRDHDSALRHEEPYRYAHALAAFDYGKFREDELIDRDEMMFHAEFGKPHLEFICNHDVILHLKIKKGHYYLDCSKPIVVTDQQRLQDLTNLDVALRVPFESRKLSGRDSKIGNGANQIRFVILDFSKAQLQTPQSDALVDRVAFLFYLTKYLELLQNAGNHVLYSLPDFDDGDLQVEINYSLVGNHVQQYTDLYGVGVDKINAYLSSMWLKAAMLANESANDMSRQQAHCLVAFNTAWTAREKHATHFHVELGAPRIHAICSLEAVLYFNIKEVSFFDGLDDENPRQYSKWTIALLIRLNPEREAGRISRCKLDISSAEVHWKLCKFNGLSSHASENYEDELAEQLVEFFRGEYLEILERLEYHIIYKETENVFNFGGESDNEIDGGAYYTSVSDEGGTGGAIIGRKVVTWTEIIAKASMHGFDQIIALSQASIDAHFAGLWASYAEKSGHYASILAKWQHDEYFSVSLKPITVRLLSHNRALVSIFLSSGYLHPLKGHGVALPVDEVYKFGDWRLSFEVELKTCKHEDLEVSEDWLSNFTDSDIWRQHGNVTDRYLQHICLDFSSAEFIHEFSKFEGLSYNEDDSPIEKVQAAVYYIQKQYLPLIAYSGLHILYTIPVWTLHDLMPTHSLTAVDFHVYSQITVTRHNCAQIAPSLEPALIILGMTGELSLPASRLGFSAPWVARVSKGISYGTLAISRRIFMDRFLELFANVNRHTTIVPAFNGIENDKWRLQLTTWAEHEFRKHSKCQWKVRSERDDFIKYAWEHRDVWRYEHEGSASDIVNGVYSVISVTKNYIELPTAFRNRSLEIKIYGESRLELTFDSTKNIKGWSATSSAKWNASLDVTSEQSGLKVHAPVSKIPQFEMAKIEGENPASVFKFCENPEKLLRKHLPPEIDLGPMVQELKAFEGGWRTFYAGASLFTLANPVFNANGDLLFELRLLGHQTVPAFPTSSRPDIPSAATGVGFKKARTSRFSSFRSKSKKTGFDTVAHFSGPEVVTNGDSKVNDSEGGNLSDNYKVYPATKLDGFEIVVNSNRQVGGTGTGSHEGHSAAMPEQHESEHLSE